GVTIETIYKNCKEILLYTPGATDGVYTIDPDGSGSIEPFDCYCDMTTDGGGWTMVGNYKYPANYEDFMYARTDASYGTDVANPNSTSAWTDWRILAGVEWPIEFVLILDRPTFSSNWEGVSAKVIYRVNNRNVMPNSGTVQDLVSGSNLYYKFNCSSGWTDVGSSSYSGDFYWYPYTSGNQYLILFHEGNNYTAYFGSGVPGGSNTWNHSARMLIR
ncbi:MAG: hypothetical protein IMY71_01360, partial [Bacteroidetes bacterium]|nr:hypothetical protein [Bacteroidota bacterium]